MKAHLTKVSLALLSTVFLLGCQDLGSGPVGPEGLGPEFTHKGDPHGKPGGGGGDPIVLEVAFTTHTGDGTFPHDDPTLTTPEPVNNGRKFLNSSGFAINKFKPKGSDILMLTAAFNAHRKAGKIVSLLVWVGDADPFYQSTDVYKSPSLTIDPPFAPLAEGFTLHVHRDHLPVTGKNASSSIGTISVADVVFTPAQ